MKETILVAEGAHKYWLGITDENEEGKYQYSSDDTFVEMDMPWFTEGGEPSGRGQNCVYGFARNSKWFDYRCSRSRVYSICELPPEL